MPTWEQVCQWINDFTDKPIVVTITGVLTLLATILIALSRTSIGKKAIAKLTNLYNLGIDIAHETNQKVKEVELLANQKIESLKAEYDQKTAALISIVNFYEESLFSLIELIPNTKVQNQLTTLKYNYIAKKEEIAEVVKLTYQDFEAEVEKRVEQASVVIHEKEQLLDERLLEIDNLIKLYKEKLEGLSSLIEEGNENGETEESTDTDSTEETL